MRGAPPTPPKKKEESEDTAADEQPTGESVSATSTPATKNSFARSESGSSTSSGYGSRPPLVLRIPPGGVVVGGLVLLVVIMLAYLVGHARGVKAGKLEARQIRQEVFGPDGGTGGGVETAGVIRGDGSTASGGDTGPSRAELYDDPREAGLNYFVLAQYNREEAERLAMFLERHGLDAFVNPVNNGKFQVISEQGFRADQLETNAFKNHRRWLKQVGRLWKDQEQGPSDLSDLWLKKYRG